MGAKGANRFRRSAGRRFRRRFTGSTSIPADSNAVTPSRGSTSSSPMDDAASCQVAHERNECAGEIHPHLAAVRALEHALAFRLDANRLDAGARHE